VLKLEQQILNVFIGQGAWCLLCILVLYFNNKKNNEREDRYNKLINDTRKDSKERETKYQQMIDKITDKFSIMEIIKQDVDYIKDKICK
jgi:hypothetical protein